MLMDRIIKAFTFRKEVYAEVEQDVEFTNTAWMLVAVVSVISQLGKLPTAFGTEGGIIAWVISSVLAVVFTLIGFALGAFIISWAGKQFFQAEVDFGEMVRVLGLAYVWNIVGVLGLLGIIPPPLCIVAPISIVAAVAGLVSWLFAVKEALDLDWGPTAITLIIGWVVNMVVVSIAGIIVTAILAVLGMGAAAVSGMM